MTLVHVGLAAVAVYYVTRIFNFTPLANLPNTDTVAFSATAVPPLLAYWIGSYLAKGERAERTFGFGMAVGAAVYAASLAGVVFASEGEPLAPLWLIFVSLWLLAGYALLLVAVWYAGRPAR